MKYNVQLKQIEIYWVNDVEAESQKEAIAKAYDLMDLKGKHSFHDDSDSEEKAHEED